MERMNVSVVVRTTDGKSYKMDTTVPGPIILHDGTILTVGRVVLDVTSSRMEIIRRLLSSYSKNSEQKSSKPSSRSRSKSVKSPMKNSSKKRRTTRQK